MFDRFVNDFEDLRSCHQHVALVDAHLVPKLSAINLMSEKVNLCVEHILPLGVIEIFHVVVELSDYLEHIWFGIVLELHPLVI